MRAQAGLKDPTPSITQQVNARLALAELILKLALAKPWLDYLGQKEKPENYKETNINALHQKRN